MAAAAGQPDGRLDLRGTPCPLNFIRTKLALERLAPGQILEVDLDAGEPEQLVGEGLASAGHAVSALPHPEQEDAIRLRVCCGGG